MPAPWLRRSAFALMSFLVLIPWALGQQNNQNTGNTGSASSTTGTTVKGRTARANAENNSNTRIRPEAALQNPQMPFISGLVMMEDGSAPPLGVVIEQVIRPTGLTDPAVDVRPVRGQIDDLLHEIRLRAEKNQRVLVTTLTKRMAEDLAEYYTEVGVRCRYLHSEVETLERIKILRGLRKGEFDVLIGINLLREGLDLPEVSLVAILDADKEVLAYLAESH